MDANSRQVGGTHYQSRYQHWDLAEDLGLSYLEGCATKYVARARKKKQAVEDLQKARHYLQKLVENGRTSERKLTTLVICRKVSEFAEANGLSALEQAFIYIISTWTFTEELTLAERILVELIREAANEADKAPVPLTEENHYAERFIATGEVGRHQE